MMTGDLRTAGMTDAEFRELSEVAKTGVGQRTIRREALRLRFLVILPLTARGLSLEVFDAPRAALE